MKLEDQLKTSVYMPTTQKAVVNIMLSGQFVNDSLLELLKKYDLSLEQYNVLRILRGQKGETCNMGLIQERMIAANSNTTRLVDKLVLKELVDRKICIDNKRKMDVLITKKGEELLKIIDPYLIDKEKQICKNLSLEELETLNYLLEKIRN
jgi:DNA-binding MarR family transcriptional regulator